MVLVACFAWPERFRWSPLVCSSRDPHCESGFIPIEIWRLSIEITSLFGLFFSAGAATLAIAKHYPAGIKHIKWVSIVVLLFFAQPHGLAIKCGQIRRRC